MTDDEVKNLPKTSALLAREEFVAWIASRKEAGAKIDIGTAELKGWWELEGDPYSLSHWRPKEADWNNYEPPEAIHHISDSREPIPCFFVRGPQSRGWVWLGDLSDDKRAVMQARVDEHNRKADEFKAERRAAGALIDTETCEEHWHLYGRFARGKTAGVE